MVLVVHSRHFNKELDHVRDVPQAPLRRPVHVVLDVPQPGADMWSDGHSGVQSALLRVLLPIVGILIVLSVFLRLHPILPHNDAGGKLRSNALLSGTLSDTFGRGGIGRRENFRLRLSDGASISRQPLHGTVHVHNYFRCPSWTGSFPGIIRLAKRKPGISNGWKGRRVGNGGVERRKHSRGEYKAGNASSVIVGVGVAAEGI
mmetsp:Transcript_5301/g.9182  ORF Transcript_5301/g.9182 Transcript_5301/m.9182 type:complete len:203 (-) Transcript_5301:658-1266(-)